VKVFGTNFATKIRLPSRMAATATLLATPTTSIRKMSSLLRLWEYVIVPISAAAVNKMCFFLIRQKCTDSRSLGLEYYQMEH